MTQRTLRTFCTEDRAAISPLFAVGILALVAVAGVGFDYGRLMALDSELQNAADQAALAAVTQLDGGDDAMIRARDAANTTFASAASAYVNETRFANDKRITGATNTRPITSLTFRFFDGYEDDTLGNEVAINDTDGAEAQVVEVTVNSRRAFYALTPVVGAISSGPVIGRALAGLETGTCNVPPMMFCVPEVGGVADQNFPTAADVGKGLKLHFKTNGPDSQGGPGTVDDTIWAPGNFGFLDVNYPTSSNQNQNSTTGLNAYLQGCTGTPVESEPGFRTPQGSALNSRFDFFPPPKKQCDEDSGDFCPAENTRKNLVLKRNGNPPSCTPAPNSIQSNDWVDAASVGIPANQNPGYPQDTCFSGSCTVIGNGDWGAATWLSNTHGVTTSDIPDLDGNGSISRYETYLWELDDPAGRLAPRMWDIGGTKYCSYPQPVDEPGVANSDTQKDRRILTVAAVDCTDLNGRAPVKIVKWVDMFLVQPVATTQNDRNFFSEIIGAAKQANGDSGFQYFGRKKAVLIR
jgi:Flp pilus assembly protein TadG